MCALLVFFQNKLAFSIVVAVSRKYTIEKKQEAIKKKKKIYVYIHDAVQCIRKILQLVLDNRSVECIS